MSKVLAALKLTCFALCFALFLVVMKSAWVKYTNKVISSGTRTLFDLDGKKQLPCFTFCVADGFKEFGLHFSKEAFMQQTFDLEDIFGAITLNQFRNESEYLITESHTMALGRCFTVRPLKMLSQSDYVVFSLQRRHDIKLFIHSPDEEFWINAQVGYPIEMAFATIEAARPGCALLAVQEVDKVYIDKPNQPCSIDFGNREGSYTNCCKLAMQRYLNHTVRCSVPSMSSVIPLDECSDIKDAVNASEAFRDIFMSMVEESASFGCPRSCRHKSYKVSLEYVNKFSLPASDLDSTASPLLILALFFSSLNIEQVIETYECDFESFLVAVGGNLGLFMGFSCLTILVLVLECLKKSFATKLWSKKVFQKRVTEI